MSLKESFFRVIDSFLSKLNKKKIIVFHSIPLMTDNTKAVYDEMLSRGLNRTYKFVWFCENNEKCEPTEENTVVIHKHGSLKERILKLYYEDVACAFIDCNGSLRKGNIRHPQVEFYLMHGSSTKRVTHYYTMPDEVDYTISLSSFFQKYDAENLNYDVNKVVPLGYPRSDWLFKKSVNLKKLFPSYSFEKVIYWMPTFRQHRGEESLNFSSISFPIIYNREIAEKINACAKENNVLLIAKPHFVQDTGNIEMYQFSNMLFIDDEFLRSNHIQNYELLGCVDALLTDYSSVYVDFMLCDKPIGLCWDDIDEFRQKEGFLFDIDEFFFGGEKIYNDDDLCSFIERISENKDLLKDERNRLKYEIHDYLENKNAARITDFILEQIMNGGRIA